MARTCDRCKKVMDTSNESVLNGEKFDLCSNCAEYISNHIRNFKGNKTLLGGLFK